MSSEIYTPPWRQREQKMPSSKKSPVINFLKNNAYFLYIAFAIVAVLGGVIFMRTYIATQSQAEELAKIDDTTPFAVKFVEVGSSSFTIEWRTKEPTIGFIKYGLDNVAMDLIGQASKDSGSAKKLHSITVDGLDAGQKYYLEIHSNARAYGEEGEALSVRTLP